MYLRGSRYAQPDNENAMLGGGTKEVTTRLKRSVLGIKKDDGIKKEVVPKRGALGEISNRVPGLATRQTSAVTKKSSFKDVKAKVVTRRVVPKAAASGAEINTAEFNEALAKLPPVKEDEQLKEEKPSYSAQLLQVNRIDIEDDPNHVATYACDIYKYLNELEVKFHIRPEYLAGQEVSGRMRSVLIDWLTEVHDQFHLLQETLYLTVAIIDRFLQDHRDITRCQLQLVGVSALSLACKYEEMFAPEITDYEYISDNTCKKHQILIMEMTILKVLKFNFGRPLPLHFLRRYSKAARATPDVHTLAKYILELSLLQYKMCHLPPSMTAAASVYLALLLLAGDSNETIWTETLAFYSTYALTDIQPVVRQLAGVVVNAPSAKQKATLNKYASSKHLAISRRPELSSAILVKLVNGTDDIVWS